MHLFVGNSGPNIVGFSARITVHEPLVNLPEDTTLKFLTVFNNEGNGYDNNTGVFTCPTHGYYFFSFFIVSYQGSHSNSLLKKNGNTFAQSAVEPLYNSQQITGGNSVMLHLSIGDQVWLQTHEHDDTSIKDSFSSFTGVMISRL